MLETFTLLAWLYVGGGDFEFIRRTDMTRRQCQMQAFRIEDERGQRAWCFEDSDGPISSPSHGRIIFQFPPCADGACGWPLPGRRRI